MNETLIHELASDALCAMDAWLAEDNRLDGFSPQDAIHFNDTLIAMIQEENEGLRQHGASGGQ